MFDVPSLDEIRSGTVTDHCSRLSLEVLRRLGREDTVVTLEASVRSFPAGVSKALFYGLFDALDLLHKDIECWALDQGDWFHENEPVLILRGRARDLTLIRPPLIGLLAFNTSIVTRAADFIAAAHEIPVYFFGARRLHPSHILQYLECAYVAGMRINGHTTCGLIDPDLLPEDCQEHLPNLIADKVEDGWKEFLSVPPEYHAQYIVLDNLSDPVDELRHAVGSIGAKLRGVLVDTTASRRGNVIAILQELLWTLKILGREDVKMALTGGVTPDIIRATKHLVSSYGVGMAAIDTRCFDYSLQVVEVGGLHKSKVGVLPGRKYLSECTTCRKRTVSLSDDEQCCRSSMEEKLRRVTPPIARNLRAVRETIQARILR